MSSEGPSWCSWRQSSAPIAARAGHQDPLARDVLADRGHVGGHRPAPEQVADAGIPDALDLRVAGEQFPQRGDHLRDKSAALGGLGEGIDHLAGLPGDRDDQHLGAGAGGDLRHLAATAEHWNTVDPQAPLGRVIIEDRHRLVGRVGLGGQPADQLGPGIPRPEDDDLHRRGSGPPGPQPGRKGHVPSAEHGDQGQRRAGHDGLRPDALTGRQRRADQHQAARDQRGGQHHRPDLVPAPAQVPPAVEPGGQAATGHQRAHAQRRVPEDGPAQVNPGQAAGGPGRDEKSAEPGDRVVPGLGNRSQPTVLAHPPRQPAPDPAGQRLLAHAFPPSSRCWEGRTACLYPRPLDRLHCASIR